MLDIKTTGLYGKIMRGGLYDLFFYMCTVQKLKSKLYLFKIL